LVYSNRFHLNEWRSAVQPIMDAIQLEDDIYIHHSQYGSIDVRSGLSHWQQLSTELQAQYFRLQLVNFLYRLYFQGSSSTHIQPQAQLDNPVPHKIYENRTVKGLDLQFYEQLQQSNVGEGYFDSGWVVQKQEVDGSLAVQKQGLTLHIQCDRHLKSLDQPTIPGTILAIRLPNHTWIGEYYMAIGNGGFPQPVEEDASIMSFYLNLSPDGISRIMKEITLQLNQRGVPFALKVLANPSDYDRLFTGILNISVEEYPSLSPLIESCFRQLHDSFREGSPLLTQPLVPGVSIAYESNIDLLKVPETHGRNCFQLLADHLIQSQQSPHGSVSRDI
jgi:hypothetical protein